MCREIVALTGEGATYCPGAPGRDGLCPAHRREARRPLPDPVREQIVGVLQELSAEVRDDLLAAGVDPEEADRYQLVFDLSLIKDPPRP